MLGTRLVSVFFLVLCSVSAHAQQTGTLSLDDFVQRALVTNKGLVAAREGNREARGLLRQAGIRPAPSLEVSSSTGRPFGTRGEEQYSASYAYLLETAGKRGKRINVAEQGLLLAPAEVDDYVRRLNFQVASRYIDSLAHQQKLEALDRLIGINRELVRLVDARVKEGDAAALERQLLSVDLRRNEAEVAVATGRLATALRELQRLAGLTGTAPFSLLEPDPIREDFSLAALQQRALADRADLRAARILVEQAEAEAELAEAQGRPDLTISGSYSRQYAGFDGLSGLNASGTPVQLKDRDDILSFGVLIPLGTRGRNAGNVEAARARAAGASLRREYEDSGALMEVENAWRRFESSRRAVQIFDEGVLAQSEQNMEIIRQAYQLGQLRLIDVLNEQRRVIETRLAYIDTKAELYRATAELEMAVGGNLR